MKSKFCAVAAALIVLLCLSPLYVSWKAGVTVYSDAAAGVPVILRYTVAGERSARAKTAQTDANGAVFFSVEPFFSVRRKNILSLRLETSAKVREIRFKGKTKTILKARDDLTFDTSGLKPRLKFNLYKFIMCVASIGYFLFFLSLPRQDESGAKPSKMLNLEFLRCVFCCEIVYQHIAEQLSLPTRSSLAVEFFFILSGYFFLKTRCFERNLWDIFSRKIKAFLPLSLFGSLTVGCLYKNADGFLGDIFFFNASFLPYTACNAPLWYLACLLWTTLFFALTLQSFEKKTAVFLLTVFTLSGIFAFSRDGANYARVGDHLVTGGLMRAAAGMGVGMFVCCFSEKSKGCRLKPALATLLEFLVFFGAITAMHGFGINHVTIFFLFAALVLLFVRKEGRLSRFFDKPVWARSGKYTFAVFVTHDVFARRVLGSLKQAYPVVLAHPVATMLVSYAVIFAFGFIAYREIGAKRVDFRRLFLTQENAKERAA